MQQLKSHLCKAFLIKLLMTGRKLAVRSQHPRWSDPSLYSLGWLAPHKGSGVGRFVKKVHAVMQRPVDP